MAHAGFLPAQMHMHDGCAGVKGGLGFLRHFFGRHRNMMLFRIGQDAVQGTGHDGLVTHYVQAPLDRCNVLDNLRPQSRCEASRILKSRPAPSARLAKNGCREAGAANNHSHLLSGGVTPTQRPFLIRAM
jgi:hypothetical protein